MNTKKTRLGKILPRILLALVLLCTVAVVMTSCSGSAISKKPLSDWAGTVESTTTDETETSGESDTVVGEDSTVEVESETEYETDSEGALVGKGENKVQITEEKSFLNQILAYIGKFLNVITKVMPANSYILTLFIFAIIFEVLFLPFSIKQQKNTIKQATLRPKEMAIRKKYAGRNDQATQQKVTQEIQELYQKENFNPLGGCLPLLIQLPIIIILYSVVIDPIKHVVGYSSDFTNFMYSYFTNHLGVSVGATNGSVEVLSTLES